MESIVWSGTFLGHPFLFHWLAAVFLRKVYVWNEKKRGTGFAELIYWIILHTFYIRGCQGSHDSRVWSFRHLRMGPERTAIGAFLRRMTIFRYPPKKSRCGITVAWVCSRLSRLWWSTRTGSTSTQVANPREDWLENSLLDAFQTDTECRVL